MQPFVHRVGLDPMQRVDEAAHGRRRCRFAQADTFNDKVVIAAFVEQHVHPVLAVLTMNTRSSRSRTGRDDTASRNDIALAEATLASPSQLLSHKHLPPAPALTEQVGAYSIDNPTPH